MAVAHNLRKVNYHISIANQSYWQQIVSSIIHVGSKLQITIFTHSTRVTRMASNENIKVMSQVIGNKIVTFANSLISAKRCTPL